MIVRKELEAVLKVKQAEKEGDGAYRERLARAMNTVHQDVWESLSEPTQHWVNSALDACEKADEAKPPVAADVPPFPGDEDKSGKTNGKAAKTADRPTNAGEQPGNEESDMATPKRKTAGAKKTAAARARATARRGGSAARPKTAKRATATNGAQRGRKGSFDAGQKIKLLVKENPKRTGSKAFKIFAKYKDGMTVGQALDAGIPWRDLRWDSTHKLIRIA
jgi:hypothetical protein